ncbi:MAG: M48 family metallopeptidase [Pseudomonadota bacterium]
MMQQQYRATYFDGQSAVAQDVFIDIDRAHETLIIIGQDGAVLDRWQFDDLRRVGDVADEQLQLYRSGDADAARLITGHKQAIVIIETLAGNLNSTDMTGAVWRKIALWSGGAAAALGLMVFVIVPALAGSLAPLISPQAEAAIGRSTLKQVEWLFAETEGGDWACSSPAGDAALVEMTQTILGDTDIPYDLNVRVVDHHMINAFALPGGYIVLMNGFVQAADTPEQVAGVLGHEIGHVANRDPLEQALRSAGTAGLLSLVFGDATGGTLLALTGEAAINASYSRAAEALADDYALSLMDKADVNPEYFAQFFDLVMAEMGETGDAADAMSWISTHPATSGRANKARALVDPTRTYRPVLDATQWAALQSICD